MRAPPILAALPEDYAVESTPRAWLALHREVAEPLRAAGYGPASDPVSAPSRLTGRSALSEIRTAAGTFLVRRFAHGGLLRALTGARFSDPERPFRELCVSDRLRQHNVRTPQVVAARAQAAPGGGFRLEIVTRRVEGTIDLGFVLAMAQRGELAQRVLRNLVAACGALVRQLHEVGCLHADLQLNNVLTNRTALEGAGPELWILDLDRSEILPALSDGDRQRNLRRLHRFVARREERDGRALTRTDFLRFFAAYDPDRSRWKADWRAIEIAHAARQGWHALGWRLEGAFQRTRDPRRA